MATSLPNLEWISLTVKELFKAVELSMVSTYLFLVDSSILAHFHLKGVQLIFVVTDFHRNSLITDFLTTERRASESSQNKYTKFQKHFNLPTHRLL